CSSVERTSSNHGPSSITISFKHSHIFSTKLFICHVKTFIIKMLFHCVVPFSGLFLTLRHLHTSCCILLKLLNCLHYLKHLMSYSYLSWLFWLVKPALLFLALDDYLIHFSFFKKSIKSLFLISIKIEISSFKNFLYHLLHSCL